MHFDVVLSVFIHPCSKKRRRAQFSICAELTRLSVCARFRCVCVCALQMCVCVCALQMCVCVCALQMCVRAVRFRCVCVRFRCVCVRALQMCVRALQMCARKTSHTALDCYSNNPERLLFSPCAFGQSLYRVLIREIEREYTCWR